MHCTQCGKPLSANAKFCPSCGGPNAVATSTAAAQVAHPVTSDVHRLAPADFVAGGATVLLFVTLFLPWYSADLFGITVTLDALWQGWMYLVLILALATIGYLVARVLVPVIRLPLPHWQILVGGTSLMALLTLLGVFLTPTGTSYSWAGFVGLVAVLVAVGASIARKGDPETVSSTNRGTALTMSARVVPFPSGPDAAAFHFPEEPPTTNAPPSVVKEAGATEVQPADPSETAAHSPVPEEEADEPEATDTPGVPGVSDATCPSCGSKTTTGVRFCRSCGSELGTSLGSQP